MVLFIGLGFLMDKSTKNLKIWRFGDLEIWRFEDGRWEEGKSLNFQIAVFSM
jgi:hypothetical protein